MYFTGTDNQCVSLTVIPAAKFHIFSLTNTKLSKMVFMDTKDVLQSVHLVVYLTLACHFTVKGTLKLKLRKEHDCDPNPINQVFVRCETFKCVKG